MSEERKQTGAQVRYYLRAIPIPALVVEIHDAFSDGSTVARSHVAIDNREGAIEMGHAIVELAKLLPPSSKKN